MSEQIAIHCPTEELFKKVRKQIGRGVKTWEAIARMPEYEGGNIACLELDGDYGREGWFRSMGYTIIPAEEYLRTKGRHIPLKEHFKLKENKMNKNISEVFDKTKDALLVEKHLGAEIGTTFIDGLTLADKKTEVLAEAKRLEKEEKDNK